ncbi:type VII secretion protein EccE [Micromonospora rhizosphaerae]|uniref:Type VII secretion protein EccE n=1 Tax=Micromonospora rhizosphaerae TaxID=568872 RepID=A0A1C6RJ80_9ACTN|nr:type VII secretion protein EccE [Micromonospora rhizosphaerae]SCL17256.1 type VII secretion protein EccE [Micromonospora rhizosphaerae]
MTAITTGRPAAAATRQPLPPQLRSAGSRPGPGVRAGQVVAAQVAVALLAAAVGRGVAATVGALLLAALLLAGAWVRVRGRWLFEWLAVGLSHLTRRRGLPPAAAPAALLGLVDPGAAVRSAELAGRPAAVVDDAAGMTALLEIGDPSDLLGDGQRALPSPLALLPTPGPESPPVRIQLLLSASPAPAPAAASGTAGTSYRQLTDGRLAGRQGAVLAVRVLRLDGWSDEELRRTLSGTVRRILRRLGPLTGRPLGEPAALRALAELAHHDAGAPTRESWQTVRSGGLLQATFRLRRWPDPRTDAGRRLVPRLLALPATATTVSLCVGPRVGADPAPVPAELTVRLAAWTAGELSVADRALRRLVADLGGALRRLDGEQLAGLAGTLPLAVARAGKVPGGEALDALELTLGEAGLMLGANRHGDAVTVRVFRPEAATRLMLVGGVPAAQLVALRAMALGARVVVQTARPRVWEPFVRGVGTVPLIPPGRPVGGVAASPLQPLLLVVDALPAAAVPGPPWQSTLAVRDELTPADVAALARVDLAILQPLDAGEAALAGAALGLGESAVWLTRIRDDMVAVVNRRALRWALLSPTPIESHLVGRPARR